jgi:hypothetical protein
MSSDRPPRLFGWLLDLSHLLLHYLPSSGVSSGYPLPPYAQCPIVREEQWFAASRYSICRPRPERHAARHRLGCWSKLHKQLQSINTTITAPSGIRVCWRRRTGLVFTGQYSSAAVYQPCPEARPWDEAVSSEAHVSSHSSQISVICRMREYLLRITCQRTMHPCR